MTNEENKKTVLRFNKEFLQGGNSNIPNEMLPTILRTTPLQPELHKIWLD